MTSPAIPVVDVQPFATAIKAAMDAAGIANAEGKKPTVGAGLPYIVWWLDSGVISDRSLRSRDGFTLTLTLQHYGASPDAVRVALRKGRTAVAALAGTTVGAQVLRVPSHGVPPPMQRDDSGTSPLWWQTDEWRLPTSPA